MPTAVQIARELRNSFSVLETIKTEGAVAELHVSSFAREEFRLERLPESFSMLGRLGLSGVLEVKPRPNEIRQH